MKLYQSLLVGATAVCALDTFSVKVLVDTKTSQCELIESVHLTQLHRAIQSTTDTLEIVTGRQNLPTADEIILPQRGDATSQKFVEILGGSTNAVLSHLRRRCPQGALQSNNVERAEAARVAAPPVVRRIVNSGDPKNRIDIVFMGDGYTASEDSRFFSDIQRLTDEMFNGDTFTQYLPLFNVWAVYVPSNQSGIGVGGKPLDTAFGLYRSGTQLRGIFTRKTAYAREVCKVTGDSACDFPSLIGNDDYYGGLGGEFVIGTRSPTTGTVVLRHEMGHNFGKVGEEYDGGGAYVGANSAPSVQGVTWKHWLTNPSRSPRRKSCDFVPKVKFKSTGTFKRWGIYLSVTGADTQDSITITLDGKPLEWTTRGTQDRSFSEYRSTSGGFSPGDHVLEVTGYGSFVGPIAKQLCSVEVYEYGNEDEFKMDDPEYIGAYPTWDGYNVKTIRPSNEKCLMRNMTSPQFCNVCQENMWQQFLSRVTFIDDIVINGKDVSLKLIPLGQLRPVVIPNERYSIQWFNNGQEVTTFEDKFTVDVSTVAGATKDWTVKATLFTPKVRKDSKNVMSVERNFTVNTTFTPVPTSTTTPAPTTTATSVTPTTTTKAPATPSPTTSPVTSTPSPSTTAATAKPPSPAPTTATLTPTTSKPQC
ncbi:hypothetical protein H257_07518 [Aphanomyces astaci]|uniref:Peptidase M11 gametolysin domain-containing protein n=1 Tax=Aphanomyces astaci TaxID=112090 RepID=W4GKH6_APHAT|nr:hypothetical protein H257_07518 [Aphanomyces astaci]ETV79534.1 hypothetical protein H257_07518 [Aphanomyces astaci]|eukprot:XP_009831375.1 hypothetical protein H257_07518 [Aphanomyces astaci]